jgi:ankyrin repeat protein
MTKKNSASALLEKYGHSFCSVLKKYYEYAESNGEAETFSTKLKKLIDGVNGEPLLHHVIENCLTEAKADYVFAVKLLIRAGADVNSIYENFTPLLVALVYGEIEVINVLIKNGAQVNLRGDDIVPILHFIVNEENEWQKDRERYFGIMKILLAAGANVDDLIKCNKKTPLHVALIKGGHVGIIDLLLAHGANINTKCHNSSLRISTSKFSVKLAVFYQRPKFDVPLSLAIRNTSLSSEDRLHVVKSLLAAGACVNPSQSDPDNPRYRPLLHVALTECSDIKIIELLIAKKVDVNAEYDQETPLTLAIKILLNLVAKSNKSNSTEELNAINVIELLIANGADMKKKRLFWNQNNTNPRLASCAEYVYEIYKKAYQKYDYQPSEVVGHAYVRLVRSFVRYGAVVSQTMRNPILFDNFKILFGICSSSTVYSITDLPDLDVNEKLAWVDRSFNLGAGFAAKGPFLNFERNDRHKIIRRMVSPGVLKQIKDRAHFSLMNKPLNRIIKGKFSTDGAGDRNLSRKNTKQKSSSSETQTRPISFDALPEALLVLIVNLIYQPGPTQESMRRYDVMRRLLQWDLDYYNSNQDASPALSIQDCFPTAPIVINRGVP